MAQSTLAKALLGDDPSERQSEEGQPHRDRYPGVYSTTPLPHLLLSTLDPWGESPRTVTPFDGWEHKDGGVIFNSAI